MTVGAILGFVSLVMLIAGLFGFFYWQYRQVLRDAKNYERGLKMVTLKIYLPPSTDDIEVSNRDERDITDETISQAQALYSIIASTATKGFKSRVYGQRHISFEMVAAEGLIDFYVAVPVVLLDVVQQAIMAAYPNARVEEIKESSVFSKTGKLSGTIGGEFSLKKPYFQPIATYQDSKRDAMRAIINALSVVTGEDGIGIQVMMRPAKDSWTSSARKAAAKIKKNRASGKTASSESGIGIKPSEILEVLWKPPQHVSKEESVETQLTATEQKQIESIEEKTSFPGFETLIRIVASSSTSARSQVLMKNIVAAFALFDSPSSNGFKFTVTKNVEQFVTSYIFRFFPQEFDSCILNSVELATIFHLPDQRNISTSQIERQRSKQVDGPRVLSTEGFLLGYNIYRGVKKEIRLATNDRRRHLYMIGQTGTGKSKFLENLALQDMLDGKGFAFIDPHGDSVEALLGMVPKERVEDVIYFNPSEMENPVGLNLFEFDTPDQRDFLVQEAIAMLYRLYDPGHTGIIGPRYEHWFRNAALTIMSDPNGSSFIDIPQVFNDDAFAKEKLKYVTDQTVLDFWNKEMAQTSDYHKSEVLGWFVSKFGAFLSNEMMRNIIGQTKSGFNLRQIMDEQKILLVNLSKGKTGELNSQLLGMIFVMKFQAAAMGRADIPEDQRKDFGLYVDEFQNFATDSFESILSEARKYRLNLLLANQFISQLTDKIREAILGNVGTIVSGRIGTTDAELMQKIFMPVFDAEDLTKLPNYEGIVVAQMNGVPSSPFSMAFLPPLGSSNPQLADALKKLSAAKFGKSRAQVEQEIFKRLRAGDEAKETKKRELEDRMKSIESGQTASRPSMESNKVSTGSSFLDEWLTKRKQQQTSAPDSSKQLKPSLVAKSTESKFPSVKVKPATNNVAPSEEIKKPIKANTAPIDKVSNITKENQVREQKDMRLEKMQQAGLGDSLEVKPLNSPNSIKHDSIVLEEQLNHTAQKTSELVEQEKKIEKSDTLRVSKLPVVNSLEDDKTKEIEEILIDIRGQLKKVGNTSSDNQ
ncbi:ATP-binding protein [Candidatus Saccharibacteria bacterium]|nr:ATP-binding protein [Candidatus Saccharibacteria bacterium]